MATPSSKFASGTARYVRGVRYATTRDVVISTTSVRASSASRSKVWTPYFESKGRGLLRGLIFEDALAFVGRTLNGMKYRDVEYSIVQGVERGKWMWSLSLDTNVKTSGQANNKPAAVIAAERAIDRALGPKKQRLVPPRS